MRLRPEHIFNMIYFILFIILITIIIRCLFLPTPAEGAERDYTRAVIHHTASHDVDINTIRQWHLKRGFIDVGYHYLVRANGNIEKGRPLNKKGAHALTGKSYSRNHYTGIALTGYDTFTDAQIASLINLLKKLNVKHIERHHEDCPGPGLDIESIQEIINGK